MDITELEYQRRRFNLDEDESLYYLDDEELWVVGGFPPIDIVDESLLANSMKAAEIRHYDEVLAFLPSMEDGIREMYSIIMPVWDNDYTIEAAQIIVIKCDNNGTMYFAARSIDILLAFTRMSFMGDVDFEYGHRSKVMPAEAIEDFAGGGLSFGFPAIDKEMRLHAGEVCVIGGFEGAGKSHWADLIACKAMMQGVKSVNISLHEYDGTEYFAQAISNYAGGVPFSQDFISDDEFEEGRRKVNQYMSFYDYSKERFFSLKYLMRGLARKSGVGLFIINNLTDYKIKKCSGYRNYADIVADLKLFVRLYCPGVALVILAKTQGPFLKGDGSWKPDSIYRIENNADIFNYTDYAMTIQPDKNDFDRRFIRIMKYAKDGAYHGAMYDEDEDLELPVRVKWQ